MDKKDALGVMGSNPETGECIAVFSAVPLPVEQAELMAMGTMFQRKPLGEIKEAFCVAHPSRRVTARGPSTGQYLACEIPAWIETADKARYDYAGTCGPVVDFFTLAEGQLALAPGLIYQPILTREA